MLEKAHTMKTHTMKTHTYFFLSFLGIALVSCEKGIPSQKDNIVSGTLAIQIISTGTQSIDLNKDGSVDLTFEIINLNDYNNPHLPPSFDTLAARVQPQTLQVLDNSTHGYVDALDAGSVIDDKGNWISTTGALATFTSAGQFKGKEKYLGLRLKGDLYGWVKIRCSAHNDTLRVTEYGYNKVIGRSIEAGQKK